MNYLKKTKPNRAPPISLSSRRYSLNNDLCFTPLKLDLSPNPHQNTEANPQKNPQSNPPQPTPTKEERQNLLLKQTKTKNQIQPTIKQTKPSHKANPPMSAKKTDKKYWLNPDEQFDKINILLKLKQSDNHSSSKNIKQQQHNILGSFADQKYLAASRNGYLRDHHLANLQKTEQTKPIDMETNFISIRSDKLENEPTIHNPNHHLGLTQPPSPSIKNDKSNNKQQQQDLDERLKLIAQVSRLNDQLLKHQQQSYDQSTKIRSLNDQLQKSTEQNQRYIQTQNQIIAETHRIQQNYQNLVVHNQTLSRTNSELSAQLQFVNDNNLDLQRLANDLQKRLQECQDEYETKLQYQLKDLSQYQRRQDMFTHQIDKLNSQIAELYQQNQTLRLDHLNKEQNSNREAIQQLKAEALALQKQLKMEREIKEILTRKYEEELSKNRQELLPINELNEINCLTNQNAMLKSRLNSYESKLESMREQSRSYLQQISLYEEREANNHRNKKLSANEWEQLTEQIQQISIENQSLKDQIERLQVNKEIQSPQTGEGSKQIDDNILELTNNQLIEIQGLRETLRQLQIQVHDQTQELAAVKLMNHSLKGWGGKQQMGDASLSERKHVFDALQSKSRQLSSLKELLFNILVFKINKEGRQADYYLNQLDKRMAALHKLDAS